VIAVPAPAPPSIPIAAPAPAAQPVPAPKPAPEVAPPGAPAPGVIAAARPSLPAPTPAPDASSESAAPPAPDPSNYAVGNGNRITVQADETLGHYAEWLEVRPSTLRKLNRMKAGAPVQIGRTTKLDFSHVTPEVFEQRRLEYHLALQEAFFEAFVVSGTEAHVLKKGETLWYLAQKKFEVPVWLLRQYNPDLDFAALRPGTRMVIPVVEPRQG
jgi:membrane-bound lytic murein transglycosylase D